MLPLFFYAEGGAARMSAIGDYVHLIKKNYDKYGNLRDGDLKTSGGVINSMVTQWETIHENFMGKMQLTNQDDTIARELKKQIGDYKQFLNDLADNPNYDAQKQSVLQEILGDYYNFLKNSIQINLATGAVANKGSKQSVLDNTDADFLQRMATNQQGIQFGSRVEGNIDMNKIIRMIENWRNTCNDYFNFLNNKKGQLKDKDIQQNLNRYKGLQGDIKRAIETMQKETLSVSKGKLQEVKITTGMRRAAKDLVHMLEILKVPSLNSIKGKVGEICYKAFINQATGTAVSLATQTIGNAVTKGGFENVEFYAPAAEHLLNELKTSSRTNLTIQQEIGKDKVIKATLSYSASSQRKADVILAVDIQGEGNPFTGNVGVSIKNYTMEDLHLVSGSPLLLFLVNNLNNDQITHYLNLFAKSEDDSITGLDNARKMAATAIKTMILYAAASGANVGKGEENIADYLLLNAPNVKDPEDQITIVNIKRLIQQLVKKGMGSVTADTVDLEKYFFPNQKDPSDITGGKRIAKIIAKLHQAKIYVTIPRGEIMSAGKI